MEKHRECYRRTVEQLLLVKKSHGQTILELEEEKRKHKEYMEKSDEFISLLDQECGRYDCFGQDNHFNKLLLTSHYGLSMRPGIEGYRCI